MAHKPTEEQSAIIYHDFRVEPTLIVQAAAGTGKTTTLRLLAEANRSKRMIYLAYNKAIAEEGKKRFPSNVEVRTAHSMAYAAVGKRYAHKLEGDIRPARVKDELSYAVTRLPSGKGKNADEEDLSVSRYAYAHACVGMVKRWLSTADPLPGTVAEAERQGLMNPVSVNSFGKDPLLKGMREIWSRMISVNDELPMLHDGYLKLFQLEQREKAEAGQPTALSGYDVILFDEAQDANPPITDMVMRQSAAKVIVGDPHQAIYAFRGAEDALARFGDGGAGQGVAWKYLLTSFRFGPEVAVAANMMLGVKGEKTAVVGKGPSSRVRPRLDKKKEPHVLLTRSNGEILEEAINSLETNERFALIGGIQGTRLWEVVDVLNLREGQKDRIKDPGIKSFDSFNELKQSIKGASDPDLEKKVDLVNRFGKGLPKMIKQIEQADVGEKKADRAHRIFCTAHKAKGLEWSRPVMLGNSFPKIFRDKERRALNPDLDEQEFNLLYVAVTRAMGDLVLPEDLFALYERAVKRFASASRPPAEKAGA